MSECRRYVCVRRISLGGEGNTLYPVLSSFVLCAVIWILDVERTVCVGGCLSQLSTESVELTNVC